MSRTQRFVLLGLAAIVAIGALVVLPGSSDDDPAATAQQAAETQSAEPAATSPATTSTAPPPEPKPKPPLLQAGDPRELTFTKGDTVRFRVRHSEPEEVHVHGYDVSRGLEAGRTRTLSFPASIEGIFEIELEQSGTELGTLKVEPK